jgi:23S rRNA G2445 N2-methylase RlmL
MHVGLRLNGESLYNRNVVEFGPTTMRATIAFGMLQAAGIQPGWIVLDPLCGSGQIPIEVRILTYSTFEVSVFSIVKGVYK